MIADRDGGVCTFSPTERVVRWYSAAGPDSQIELVGTASLPQQIPFQGECKMDNDPKTGNLAFWSEGIPNKIWSLALDEEGVSRCLKSMATRTSPSTTSSSTIRATCWSRSRGPSRPSLEPSRVSGCRQLITSSTMFQCTTTSPATRPGTDPSTSCFRMLRSSNNLPSEIPVKEYDNAGLLYESSESAHEVVDCDADINRDHKVDVSDMLIVIAEWGKEHSPADIAHDGTVDVLDLLAVFETWGSCR